MIDIEAAACCAPRAGFALNESSEAKLSGVDPDLVRVVRAAATRCEQHSSSSKACARSRASAR